ncbi:hypothetical protein DY000_02050380 [Brassica cretica]|uniref:Uncharacterized protein n=1 Tax=Brassica cretica TaxID=69181 RepID=A0ABQ7F5U6_BRACR|nr:hypothetical protein DY000_02050380 [Brassica cretica]
MVAPSIRSNDATNESRRRPRSTRLQLPGLVLILKSMLLSEQHGRETIGGRGQAGTPFHLRRRISGDIRSFNTTTGRTNSMMKST